ncbi:MAG: HAD hydrolase-like protein [Rubricoccaceae bacterium]|nr:HAD hydrolase-like protein [Rubricoccaceae bacterium]
MKLLLFDIDGTLLHTHGLGRSTVGDAMQATLGRTVPTAHVSFSGKTDPQIFREILRTEVDERALDEAVATAVEAYEASVRTRIPEAQVTALPGVRPLLDHLATTDLPLGLLTGNLQPMAYLKLGRVDLGGFFPFGAFGSDHEDRNALPEVAIARAEAHTGRCYEGRDVVVIGDTPRDIACGKAAGTVTVAVATGRFDRDALAAHEPDLLLDTLEEMDRLLDAVA